MNLDKLKISSITCDNANFFLMPLVMCSSSTLLAQITRTCSTEILTTFYFLVR